MRRHLLAICVMTLASTDLAMSLPLPTTQQPAAKAPLEPVEADHVPDAPTQIGPYAFNVYLEMSPAALSLLTKKKEQVVVSVTYGGTPTKAGKRFANSQTGLIETPLERVTASPTAKQVTVRGSKVTAADVDRILDQAVSVSINVSTARLSGPDNLLNCEFYEESLFAARESGANIKCKLIAE